MANDPMLEMFIFENVQLTERLEEILIAGENSDALGEEDINEIFRIMHTIKGSSAMMEYDRIATVAHSVEDMFFYIREHSDAQPDWPVITDHCLESADFFKQEVAKIQQGLPSDGDMTELLATIHAYMDVLTGKAAPAPPAPVAPPPEPDKEELGMEAGQEAADPESSSAPQSGTATSGTAELPDGVSPECGAYWARIFFESGCKMENIRAYQIANALSDHCERVDSSPAELLEDCSDEIIANGVAFYIYSKEDSEKIHGIINDALFVANFEFAPLQGRNLTNTSDGVASVEDEVDIEAENEAMLREEAERARQAAEAQAAKTAAARAAQSASAPAPAKAPSAPTVTAPAAPAAPATPAAPAAPTVSAAPAEVKQSFISVSVDKLDRLMDLVGELVISVSMVVSNPDLENLVLDNFEKSAALLTKNTSELQDVIMSVRMIPVSSTFHKMSRIVRDTSRKLNKEVELVILGEETEVDKNIIDNLSDPLMHIIRNSMDHGIEDSREEREAMGKPPAGKIILEARNSGSDVIISCTDDGQGLNRDKILEKANRQGILTKPESEYSDREIYNLIMLPGFSTNETVTELSGRGVGMDVVKKNIEKIGGTVVLDSVPGTRMTVTIRIPLTLAILAGIEIKVGKNFYLVPTLNIRESFKPQVEDIIVDPDGNEMILFRGECYSIIRLHSLFHVHTDVLDFPDGIMIMVEDEGRMVGLFADRLVGEQQVVVKPLPPFITKRIGSIRGISGCTILGNGEISLIVDVKSLTDDESLA